MDNFTYSNKDLTNPQTDGQKESPKSQTNNESIFLRLANREGDAICLKITGDKIESLGYGTFATITDGWDTIDIESDYPLSVIQRKPHVSKFHIRSRELKNHDYAWGDSWGDSTYDKHDGFFSEEEAYKQMLIAAKEWPSLMYKIVEE